MNQTLPPASLLTNFVLIAVALRCRLVLAHQHDFPGNFECRQQCKPHQARIFACKAHQISDNEGEEGGGR